MAEKTVWLLVGVGGIGLAAGAWWRSRQNGGLSGLEPLDDPNRTASTRR